MEKKRIAEMEIGEIGFIFPFSLWMDQDGDYFLNEDHEAYKSISSTRNLKIMRTEKGYVALINEVKHLWTACFVPPFLNTDTDLCYGKVVGFNDILPDQFRRDSLTKQMQEAIEAENYELAGEIRDKIILN